MLRELTVEDIRAWHPCYDPVLEGYCDKEWRGTILDVINFRRVPVVDRIWCAIQCLSDKQRRLFAAWCARRALSLIDNPDPRSIKAVDVAERFANGEATTAELLAARAAAWSAAGSAARSAAEYAARSAAGSAVEYAWSAARGAERRKQLAYLKKVLKQQEEECNETL